jgi:hypothetical protein
MTIHVQFNHFLLLELLPVLEYSIKTLVHAGFNLMEKLGHLPEPGRPVNPSKSTRSQKNAWR